jgi:hypothetical protein
MGDLPQFNRHGATLGVITADVSRSASNPRRI